MKNLIKRAHFALYILLTCVFFSCGLKHDIKMIDWRKQQADSLQIEFDKALIKCDYYQSMQDSFGGAVKNFDVWCAYRDSSDREINKMTRIANEFIRVRNAR